MSNPFHNRPEEWANLEPLIGTSMCELGNKKNGPLIYKRYFESLGIQHTSIDWNGQDGALKLDLRKPLRPELGQFDMLTNIGTSEHVGTTPAEQAGCWENIHNLVKLGGVYIGQTPYPDGFNWWWHGEWYPTDEWFKSFAELNGWEIERLYKDGKPPYACLYARMKKVEDKPFTMPDFELMVRNKMRARHPAPPGYTGPNP